MIPLTDFLQRDVAIGIHAIERIYERILCRTNQYWSYDDARLAIENIWKTGDSMSMEMQGLGPDQLRGFTVYVRGKVAGLDAIACARVPKQGDKSKALIVTILTPDIVIDLAKYGLVIEVLSRKDCEARQV